MEYAQERVTTLHDLTGRAPEVPVDRAAVVVPMTERDHDSLAAERLFSALESVEPARVIVALRAPEERTRRIHAWLSGFDVPVEVLWCNSPPVLDLLAGHGLDGPAGKGRDVWLALGVAAAAGEYVLAHDADSRTVTRGDFERLLFPLQRDFSFVKGYYARVEDGRLYGRLCRLFYAPLVRALREERDAPILAYLGAFRYALSGEFAATADFVRGMRAERGFGFEVGALGEAFAHDRFAGTAQVDLGRYRHDHRPVSGLSGMSEAVGAALFRVVEEQGVDPGYATLPDRYRGAAEDLIRGYAADAAFNGLSYDAAAERQQVDAYADAIVPPGADDRLPAWSDVDLDPAAVRDRSREALATVTKAV
jgi:glucosyl-3-phosphoglycerate synthase